MEGVTTEPLFPDQETKVEVPGREEPETSRPLQFSLILESRYRELLKREILALKKGKSRKFSKKDYDRMEEEVRFVHFDPTKFLERHLSQFLPSNVMEAIDKDEITDVKPEEETPVAAE